MYNKSHEPTRAVGTHESWKLSLTTQLYSGQLWSLAERQYRNRQRWWKRVPLRRQKRFRRHCPRKRLRTASNCRSICPSFRTRRKTRSRTRCPKRRMRRRTRYPERPGSSQKGSRAADKSQSAFFESSIRRRAQKGNRLHR